MKYVDIQGVKISVSKMVLGTEYFNLTNEMFRSALLDQWLDQGGNAVDTGRIYGRVEGDPQSERLLGRWMSSRDTREDTVVITKCCHPSAEVPKRVTAEMMEEDLKKSLNELQTDHIDILLMHRDDPQVPVGEIIDWLNGHKAAGQIHSFGASNWSQERYQSANTWAKDNGKTGFSLVSNYAGLATMDEPLWPGCRDINPIWEKWLERNNVPNLSWCGLSHGFFSGRYTPDRLDRQDMAGAFYSTENWARLERAKTYGERKGLSATQVALMWLLNRTFTSLAAFWVGNFDEFREGMAVAEMEMSPEDIAYLLGPTN